MHDSRLEAKPDARIRYIRSGKPGRQRFKFHANREQFDRFFDGQSSNERPPVRDDLDQPLGRKPPEGLAQKTAAYAKFRCKIPFNQTLTGHISSAVDTGYQVPGYAVTLGAMPAISWLKFPVH
jgi:hypothetical protein